MKVNIKDNEQSESNLKFNITVKDQMHRTEYIEKANSNKESIQSKESISKQNSKQSISSHSHSKKSEISTTERKIQEENKDTFKENDNTPISRLGSKEPSKALSNRLLEKLKFNEKNKIKEINDNDSDKDSVEAEGDDGVQHMRINIPQFDQNDDIYDFYEYLRSEYLKTGQTWEDPEFQDDISLFMKNNEIPDRLKQFNIEFERPDVENEDIHFFSAESSPNIKFEFKIKRGMMNDRFFLGAVLMLFRKKEEYFTNLVLDFAHIRENIKAGFCGFTFFINGEWKNVTVDTKLPWHQTDDMTLSIATSNKSSFWLCLFAKAYAKIHKSYDILNNVSLKNTLVDFTGGIAKKIQIKDKMEDVEKKNLFDEIRRCIAQKYLIGCMKFEETFEDVLLN